MAQLPAQRSGGGATGAGDRAWGKNDKKRSPGVALSDQWVFENGNLQDLTVTKSKMCLMFWKDMPEAMIAVCTLDGFAIILELPIHAISKWSHSTSYLPTSGEKWQSNSKCQPSMEYTIYQHLSTDIILRSEVLPTQHQCGSGLQLESNAPLGAKLLRSATWERWVLDGSHGTVTLNFTVYNLTLLYVHTRFYV